MPYSKFSSFGVKVVLVGIWDLICDGYLLVPSNLFMSLAYFSIPIAAGQMGLQALNAVGLALVGDYLIGLTFPMVASTVFQAYISRYFYPGKEDLVRSTFQKTGLIWLTIFFLIQMPILSNWELILLIAQQDHVLAHMAQIFIFIQMPRYLATYIAYLFLVTMFAQDIVWPTVVNAILSCVLVILAQILVLRFCANVIMLAVAVSFAQILTTLCITCIFLLSKATNKNYEFWKAEASSFFEWTEMFVQTLLSIGQQFGTRLIAEVGIVIAGVLSPVELGAATILRRYTTFACSIPLNSLGPIVTKSIGSSIGKRSHVSVRVYIFSGLLLAFTIGAILALISVAFRQPLAELMTNEPAVVQVTVDLTIIVSIFDWLMMVYLTNIFIFRGLGAMTFPTIAGVAFQYGFGLPLALLLVFLVGMRLGGYYLALIVSFLLELAVESVYLHRSKLPVLRIELESVEKQPLLEMHKPLDKSLEQTQKRKWHTNCMILVIAALIINGVAIGIYLFTNAHFNKN